MARAVRSRRADERPRDPLGRQEDQLEGNFNHAIMVESVPSQSRCLRKKYLHCICEGNTDYGLRSGSTMFIQARGNGCRAALATLQRSI